MGSKQEAREAIAKILAKYTEIGGDYDTQYWQNHRLMVVDRILSVIHKLYPIMYQEEAELVGWLLDKGWIPPEEAKDYRKVPELKTLSDEEVVSACGMLSINYRKVAQAQLDSIKRQIEEAN